MFGIKTTATLGLATAFFAGSATGAILVEDNFDSQNGGTGWAPGSSWNSTVSGGELNYTGVGEARDFAAPVTASEYWLSITWEQTSTEQSFVSTGAWEGDNASQPYFLGFHETFQPGNPGQPRFPVEFSANAAPNGGYNTILIHVTNIADGTSFDFEAWSFAGDGSSADPNNLGAANWMTGTRNTSFTTPDFWRIVGDIDVDFDRIAIATTAGEALVPEPGSIALLGLGGLLIARRRRG